MEPGNLHNNKIILKTNKGMQAFDLKNLLFCKADGNYTRLFMQGQPNNFYIICKTLKETEQLFNSLMFFRVCKSHLVNFGHIEHFDSGTNMVLLKNGDAVPVSRRKKSVFKKTWEWFINNF